MSSSLCSAPFSLNRARSVAFCLSSFTIKVRSSRVAGPSAFCQGSLKIPGARRPTGADGAMAELRGEKWYWVCVVSVFCFVLRGHTCDLCDRVLGDLCWITGGTAISPSQLVENSGHWLNVCSIHSPVPSIFPKRRLGHL